MQENSNLYLNKDKIVRATAGAGKTTSLIEDVYQTYKSHKSTYGKAPKILLTTFTVKAANELSERLFSKASKIDDKDFLSYCLSSNLEVGTMHSVFSSILNQLDQKLPVKKYISHAYKLNCAKGFFTEAVERKKLVSYFSEPYDFKETLNYFVFLERSGLDFRLIEENELFKSVQSKCLNLLDELSELRDEIKAYDSFSQLNQIINRLDKKKDKTLHKFINQEFNQYEFIAEFCEYNLNLRDLYRDWKNDFSSFVSENGLYTLEDMESLILKLTEGKETQSKWDYCFLDEYQDTSPEQKELVDRFCSESVKYFVGDPFQSIYFFRGARKEIFDQEFNRIKEAGLSLEYKTNSYRSSKSIVNFVNHMSKIIFDDFDPMIPTKEKSGSVDVAFFEDQTFEVEVEYLIEKIKGLNPKDVLILSKQTKNLSKAFKRIKESGLSALPLYGSGLSDYLESFELINFLKFISDTKNEEALKVLIFSRSFDFTEKEISDFIQKYKKEDSNLWDVVKNDHRLSQLKELANGSFSYSLALKIFLIESGFLDYVDESDKSGLKEFNSFKILGALEEEESKPDFNIQAFCDDLLSARYPFGKESVESDSSYRLMTVHGSKGLEAKHVFILGANQGYRDLDNYPLFFDENTKISAAKVKDKNKQRHFPFWHQEQIEKEKLIKKQENRRLLYVAMTRAEESLSIIGSGKREKAPSEPSWMSQMLNEKDKDVLSYVNFIGSEDFKIEEKENNTVKLKTFSGFFENKNHLSYNLKDQEDTQDFPIQEIYNLSMNIKRGIDFHAFMEGSVSNSGDEYAIAVDYLNTQKDFPFNKVLSDGFREWGYDFLNPESNQIESGKIDIWADLDETVWIVDYKTGSLYGVDKGFEQLKRYQSVLRNYLGENKNYKLVLTFPFQQKTLVQDG